MYCKNALISVWPWMLRFSIFPLSILRLMSPMESIPSLLITASTFSTIFLFPHHMLYTKTGNVLDLLELKAVHISEILLSILTLCWLSKVCIESNWFSIEKLCLVSFHTNSFFLPQKTPPEFDQPSMIIQTSFSIYPWDSSCFPQQTPSYPSLWGNIYQPPPFH